MQKNLLKLMIVGYNICVNIIYKRIFFFSYSFALIINDDEGVFFVLKVN